MFVDSSAWLALISADDGHHVAADRLFEAALHRRCRLVTTDLVVAEVHRLLLFRAGIAPATVALDRIMTSPSVQVEFVTREHHDPARAWLAKLDDQVITYTDAVSFAVMSALRCRLALSFDSDFTIAGFEVVHQAGQLA